MVLDESVLENVRPADLVPLHLLADAPGHIGKLMAADCPDAVEDVIARMACVSTLGLANQCPTMTDMGLRGLIEAYALPFEASGLPNDRQLERPAKLWLVIIEHVMALGSLAVRLEQWSDARRVALQPPPTESGPRYKSWIWHGLTMAARHDLLWSGSKRCGMRELSLISLARHRMLVRRCLRPDIDTDAPRALNSLCQFDALTALGVMHKGGRVGRNGYYLNFSRFPSDHTEPALVGLIEDPSIRRTFFPRPDAELAEALSQLDRHATSEGSLFGGWSGLHHPAIVDFVDANSHTSTY